MNVALSELARLVNQWCQNHQIAPANGQAAQQVSERNIRYYRSLGLVDPPLPENGGYSEKHRLQLIAIRLLQSRGLPLNRIQELLLGRNLAQLREIQQRGLNEQELSKPPAFLPGATENWRMTPIDDDFLLISRRGQAISEEMKTRLLETLNCLSTETSNDRSARGQSFS